jgi:hypothetical protein
MSFVASVASAFALLPSWVAIAYAALFVLLAAVVAVCFVLREHVFPTMHGYYCVKRDRRRYERENGTRRRRQRRRT